MVSLSWIPESSSGSSEGKHEFPFLASHPVFHLILPASHQRVQVLMEMDREQGAFAGYGIRVDLFHRGECTLLAQCRAEFGC